MSTARAVKVTSWDELAPEGQIYVCGAWASADPRCYGSNCTNHCSEYCGKACFSRDVLATTARWSAPPAVKDKGSN